MTTYLGKSCSFCLPRVPFVNCRQFMYLVISLLVLRAGYGIWLYQFLIIAYLFTFLMTCLILWFPVFLLLLLVQSQTVLWHTPWRSFHCVCVFFFFFFFVFVFFFFVFLAHLSWRLTRWAYRIGVGPASVCACVRACVRVSVNNFKHEYL